MDVDRRRALHPGRCTARRWTGNLCGLDTIPDAPFPLCEDHAREIYKHLLEKYPPLTSGVTSAEFELNSIKRGAEERRERRAQYEAAAAAQSQVYYMRIHDHIKIGYSTNIRARCTQLRISVDAVLATEPGDRKLEKRRHQQFAQERIGRREDFEPSERLMAHIDSVLAEHGEPNLTTYPKATA